MKFFDIEVSEEKILEVGKKSIHNSFLIFSGIAVGILVGGLFWLFISIVIPLTESITEISLEPSEKKVCYALFVIHVIGAIATFVFGKIKTGKMNPFDVGRQKVEEECRIKHEKEMVLQKEKETNEFNVLLEKNKANYANDLSIIKIAFYVFQEKQATVTQSIISALSHHSINREPKAFTINGHLVLNNKIDYIEKYETNYIGKIIFFKFIIYLPTGKYTINETQIELTNSQSRDMTVILEDDGVPIIASEKMVKERYDAKLATIISEENVIKSKTIVRRELIDGPRNFRSRKSGTLAEYEYRKYIVYYADGHTEPDEETNWVRDLNGFGDPYQQD